MKRLTCLLFVIILLLGVCVGFCSCGSGKLIGSVEGDGKRFELYGAGNSVNTVVVYGGDGYSKKIGKYKVKGEASSKDNFGFELIDLNFDGCMDFRVPVLTANGVTHYKNYLANPQGDFYSSAALDALTSVTVDEDEKILSAVIYKKEYLGNDYLIYIETKGTHAFEWSAHNLREIQKYEEIYYSENDIYCITTYEMGEGGELVIDNERWLKPKKYEEYKNGLSGN